MDKRDHYIEVIKRRLVNKAGITDGALRSAYFHLLGKTVGKIDKKKYRMMDEELIMYVEALEDSDEKDV